MKILSALFVSAFTIIAITTSLPSIAQTPTPITASTNQLIKDTLNQIGLSTPVHTITPTGIDALLHVTLTTGESLLITSDARYVINATVEPNPSTINPIPANIMSDKPTGTQADEEYRIALLANMDALPLVDSDTVFFHTSIKGLLWAVAQNGTPFLVSSDARHIIGGDVSVIDHGRLIGLDTAFETAKNRHTLTTLDPDNLIIYPANNERAVVYVATDINCPYCKILHKNIPNLNAKGITVKVIGYPVYDESPEPMRQIWCERDNAKRAKLLDLAMKGIKTNNQCSNDDNHLLPNITKARPLDIIATPAIYGDDGRLFEGSVANDELVKFLISK